MRLTRAFRDPGKAAAHEEAMASIEIGVAQRMMMGMSGQESNGGVSQERLVLLFLHRPVRAGVGRMLRASQKEV